MQKQFYTFAAETAKLIVPSFSAHNTAPFASAESFGGLARRIYDRAERKGNEII